MNIIKHFLTALFLFCLIMNAFAGINTWTQCSGTDGQVGLSVVIDTTTPGRMYAGTWGMLRSEDYGTTWIYSAFTVEPYLVSVSIAINPKSPNTVYTYMSNGGGILKNTTFGYGDWETITNDLACAVPNLLFDPENAGRMYAGACLSGYTFVYRSDDTGYHWTPSMSGITTDQGTNMLIMHPTQHNILYAGAAASPGIFVSFNGATTWQSLPLYKAVNCLAIDLTNPQYIYAGGAIGGFASSFDEGYAWNICTDTTITNYEVNTIIVNPLNPKIIYIGTNANGIFKSKDRGNTWFSMNTGLPSYPISALVYDTITRTLFAGTNISSPPQNIPIGVWMYQDTDLTTPPPPVSVPKDIWQMFE